MAVFSPRNSHPTDMMSAALSCLPLPRRARTAPLSHMQGFPDEGDSGAESNGILNTWGGGEGARGGRWGLPWVPMVTIAEVYEASVSSATYVHSLLT